MQRLSLVLAAVAGLLAGALGFMLLNPPSQPVDTAAIRAVVETVLDERAERSSPAAVAALDAESLNPLIESYLLDNPRVLERMTAGLEDLLRTEEAEKSRLALTQYDDAIFNAPGQIVLGNPDGDVTLVEFFDYNCGYCRNAVPDMVALLEEDPNLRIVLKEFPILSNESVEAARISLLVAESDADYLTFHQTLFSGRGKVDKAAALAAAAEQGLSRVDLELRMGEPQVSSAIQQSYEIAQALGISGTPTYIIGTDIVPGAIGADALRERIANMRACGKTRCV